MPMSWEKLLNSERRRPTSGSDDHREQFERDYDRSIFSTPVKRLQDKAQVFPLETHDAVRTRLTHSLEVSSVARGLATRATNWMKEADLLPKPGMDRQIESIARCCGLIHDLGNPPFGHAGEEAIQGWFYDHSAELELGSLRGVNDQLAQDFLKFEGNAQTLRLVAKLQILADKFGLNLTYATLSASCKYLAPSHLSKTRDDHSWSKPGYFASENDLVQEIREKTGTGDARNPITFLVEAADDIVYSVADIEDGVKKGVLSWDLLMKELENEQNGIPKNLLGKIIDRMNLILNTDILKPSKEFPDDTYASVFRTAAILHLVVAASSGFQANYKSIMDGHFTSDLFTEGDSRKFVDGLKKIGRERIYCTPSILKLELAGRRIINELMTLFWEGANKLPLNGKPNPKGFPGKLGALLSESYREAFRMSVDEGNSEIPEQYLRLQLVTDYVCGMTDSFAKRLHSELTNG